MGSAVIIYIPSFIQIGPAIQKLTGGDLQIHIQNDDFISPVRFFQNKESRLKRNKGNKEEIKKEI
jgi:hypothetical protein